MICSGRSFLDEIVRASGDIDVYVISGTETAAPLATARERVPSLRSTR